MWRSTIIRLAAGAAVALLAVGCEGEPDASSEGPGPDESEAASDSAATGRSYERVFAFAASESDTTVLVPILFTSRSVPGGVVRGIRGWLGRAGTWELFVDEGWRTPPSRTAWRILPRGPMRLVVGENDAIESVVYRQPPRVLELDLGEGLVEWTGPRGGVYRLEESTLLLGTRPFQGVVMDLARSRSVREVPGGDWAFLLSGDSLQVVLQSPRQSEPGAEGAWVAYVRHDVRQEQWPDVTVEWSESQAYEPARRDVPAAWRFRSLSEEVEGSLEARSVDLSAGEGGGPVLPVTALFAVEGTVRLEARDYPVRGLVWHHRE